MTPPSLREVTAARRAVVERAQLPSVRYDKDGDCLETLFSDDDYKGLRINGYLTLYISRKSKLPIGSMLKDVVKFIRMHAPGFDLDEPFRPADLLQYFLWATKWADTEQRKAFELLIESTKDCAATNREVSCS
jgi:hypothetical protein